MDETIDAGVEEIEPQAPEVHEEGVEETPKVSSAEEEDTTDWKTIAQNYKNALTQKRQFINKGMVAPIEEEDEDEDRPVTLKDLKTFQQNTMAVVADSKEDTLLNKKITDPEKRAYVKQLLDTRIVRTGTSDDALSSDIDAALAIADSQKKDKVISELKRAAANKPKSPSAGGSSEPEVEKKPYKIDAALAATLEKRAQALGLDPEKFKTDYFNNLKRTKVVG